MENTNQNLSFYKRHKKVLGVLAVAWAVTATTVSSFAFDGTSVITPEQATALATDAQTNFNTIIATVVAVSGLLLTMFFGNKILGLIKGALRGH